MGAGLARPARSSHTSGHRLLRVLHQGLAKNRTDVWLLPRHSEGSLSGVIAQIAYRGEELNVSDIMHHLDSTITHYVQRYRCSTHFFVSVAFIPAFPPCSLYHVPTSPHGRTAVIQSSWVPPTAHPLYTPSPVVLITMWSHSPAPRTLTLPPHL